jgi:hypothetical protein
MIEMETKKEAVEDVAAVVTTIPKPIETAEGRTFLELQPIGCLPSLRSILKDGKIKMSIGIDRLLGYLISTHKGDITIRRVVIKAFTREGLPFPSYLYLQETDQKGKLMRDIDISPATDCTVTNWHDVMNLCVLPRKFQEEIILCNKEQQVSRSNKLTLELRVCDAATVLREYVDQRDSQGRAVRTEADFARDVVDLNFRLQVDFVVAKA